MHASKRLRWLLPFALSLLLTLLAVMSVSADVSRQSQTTAPTDTRELAPAAPPIQFPRYHIYTPPATLGQDAGEPTLGINHNTNAVMYIAILETLRIHFNDDYSQDLIDDPEVDHRICSAPVKEVWLDKSYVAHVNTLDPILFTDPLTGRTFSSQLAAKTSILGLSDDDGETWLPSEGGSFLTSGVDHQTLASGPYPPNFPIQGTIYPHAVYYCGQDIAYANCARSDDGGMSFGPAIPMYTLATCNGLHGHIQVEPLYTDSEGAEQGGTIYVPIRNCAGGIGIAVSKDAGTTWNVSIVPGALASTKDPSVGIGAAGTVYAGYADNDQKMMVAISHDQGDTWDSIVDIAADVPELKTVTFPSAIAGDDDRAAITFFGTTYENATQYNTEAVWYLYVSHTFDGGQTWNTINLTPNDPIQRGSICTVSSSCNGDRNLLDFYDIKVDREGRAVIGYDDGCVGACVNDFPNSFTAVAAIARQEGGLRLYSAFDEVDANTATIPAAPRVDSVAQDAVGDVTIAWTLADDGGSDILGYNVYREEDGSGTFALLNTDGLIAETSYVDQTTILGTDYRYKVTAENALGEGANCLDFPIGDVTGGSPCVLPGVQVVVDSAGDATTIVRSDVDITAVAIAEPYDATNPQENFVVTLQIADLLAGGAANSYYAMFNFDGVGYYLAGIQLDLLTGGTYEFGTFVYNENDNFLTTTPLGTPDEASFDPSGSIVFTIAKDRIVGMGGGTPVAGSVLNTVDARAYDYNPITGETLFEDRPGSPGTYNVVSNASCNVVPNAAPTALVVVTPTEGQSPLDVMIDASTSFDVDESDTIVEYTFDLDDGSEPIVQASPILTHTYSHTETQTIEYRITVKVKDSRGLSSRNTAAQVVEVLPTQLPTALTTANIAASSSRIAIWIGISLIGLLTVGVAATTVRLRRK